MNAFNFLNDPDGNPSTIRLINSFSFFIVIVTWCVLSIKNNVMQQLPESLVTLLFFLLAGKLGQSIFVEKKKPCEPQSEGK